MGKLLLILAVTMPTVGAQQRLPLQKKRITLKSPTSYAKRILRHDPQTGRAIYYDPKPRVVAMDAKAGKYALRWIGYDGKEKTILYQRPDALTAVVSARVMKTASGQYLYAYHVKNLTSSGQHLSGFAVQTFTSDAKPQTADNNIHFGRMSRNAEMRTGEWVRFGFLPDFEPTISPGRSVEVALSSSAPPGLVECRIHGGVLGMIGVNEEPPHELESALPGYEIWPRGYTIGPNVSLTSLTLGERLDDLHLWLPQFKRLGWMTAAALRWYERNLHPTNLELLHKRAEQDLKSGNITAEVHAIIQAIR